MKKREKIILAAVGVALLYAIYSLVFAPSQQGIKVATGKGSAKAQEVSDQLSEELKKESLSDTERYILERVEAEWVSDPFLGQKLSSIRETAKGGAGAQAADFAYSGYLEVNRKKLAIINGIEYQVGEQLESGGYTVQSIDPDKVVLEDIGKHGQILIPFTGQIF
jgi:hypothetical protein